MEKLCKKCGETKTVDKMVKRKGYKDGYRNLCKECYNLSKRKTPLRPDPKPGHKFCCKCGIEKSLNEFHIRNSKGKKRPSSYCKPCEHERDNNRYQHFCKICKKIYRSGKKQSTYCRSCFDKKIVKTYSIFGKLDQKGKNNPMYGIHRFGKANPNYKPHKTEQEREKERLVEGYGLWRLKVYERDEYICQSCGYDKGKILIAHHLDGWDWCKDKRLDVNNGVTLCKHCHKAFHDEFGYGNNTRKQFITYMKSKKCSI